MSFFDYPIRGGGGPQSGQTAQEVLDAIAREVAMEARHGNTTRWSKNKIAQLNTDDIVEMANKYVKQWSGSQGYKNGNIVIHNNALWTRQNATGTVTDSSISPGATADTQLADADKAWLAVIQPGMGRVTFEGIADAINVALVAGKRIFFSYDANSNRITATVRGYEGQWQSGSFYSEGDIVKHSDALYYRKTDSGETAPATNVQDGTSPNNASGKWELMLHEGATTIPNWAARTAYDAYAPVVHASKLYRAKRAIADTATDNPATDTTNWEELTSSGGSSLDSDGLEDLLEAGDNVTIEQNAAGDKVKISSTGGASSAATGDVKTKATPLITFTITNNHNVHFLDGQGGRADVPFPTFDLNKMYNLEVMPASQSERDTAIINKTFSGRTFEGLADTTTPENSTGIIDDNFRKFEGPSELTFDLLKKNGKLGYQANVANFYGGTCSIYELQAEGVVVGGAGVTELFNSNVNITAQNTVVNLTGFTLQTADIDDDDFFLFEAGQPLTSTESLSTEVTGKEIKRAGTIANNAVGNFGGSSFAQLLVINRNTGVELGVILIMRRANGQMALQISASSQGDQYDPMPLRVTRRRYVASASSNPTPTPTPTATAYFGTQTGTSFTGYNTDDALGSVMIMSGSTFETVTDASPRGILTNNNDIAYIASPSTHDITSIIAQGHIEELDRWTEITNAFTANSVSYNVRYRQNQSSSQLYYKRTITVA